MRFVFTAGVIIALAIGASAIAFPVMIIAERSLPNTAKLKPDTWERIRTRGQRFHDLKNLTSELVRADPQWWSKAGSFTVAVVITLTSVLAALLII